jgi:hypothetical protein
MVICDYSAEVLAQLDTETVSFTGLIPGAAGGAVRAGWWDESEQGSFGRRRTAFLLSRAVFFGG